MTYKIPKWGVLKMLGVNTGRTNSHLAGRVGNWSKPEQVQACETQPQQTDRSVRWLLYTWDQLEA